MAKTRFGKSSTDTEAVTDETGSTTTGRSIATRDPRFFQLARQNGILDDEPDTTPRNLDDILDFIDNERLTPGLTDPEFKRFRDIIRTAPNERSVAWHMNDLLAKREGPTYVQQLDVPFARLPKGLGFNQGMSEPVPDFIEGFLRTSFACDDVLETLGPSVDPTGADFSIPLAHLVGEFKRVGGDVVCGSRQVAYDAACLVFGRDRAMELLDSVDEPDTAYVAGFVCSGDRVRLSVHWSTYDGSGKKIYRQHELFDEAMLSTPEKFRLARRKIRNLQDWAMQNADLCRTMMREFQRQGERRSSELATQEPAALVETEFADLVAAGPGKVAKGGKDKGPAARQRVAKRPQKCKGSSKARA